MPDTKMHVLTDQEREQTRQWLDSWRRIGPVLEAERWRRVAALSDDEAWCESQGLLSNWEAGMAGDAGEGLALQQDVFRRWRQKG